MRNPGVINSIILSEKLKRKLEYGSSILKYIRPYDGRSTWLQINTNHMRWLGAIVSRIILIETSLIKETCNIIDGNSLCSLPKTNLKLWFFILVQLNSLSLISKRKREKERKGRRESERKKVVNLVVVDFVLSFVNWLHFRAQLFDAGDSVKPLLLRMLHHFHRI